MNVACLLSESARRSPEAPAWKFGDCGATYAELAGRVGRIAAGLRTRGLAPGDRVVVCLPNRPELLEVLMATLWAGLVTVPVNWHLHPEEVSYIVGQCGARAIVLSDATAAVTDALPAGEARPVVIHADHGHAGPGAGASLEELALSPVRPGDPADVEPGQAAWLFYTSGTTGRPKGATLSHRSLLAMTLNYYADVDPIRPGSVLAHAAPLTHGSGLYLIPAIGRAAANVISDVPTFDAASFLGLIERERATHVAFLAPVMLRRVLDSPRLAGTDLSALHSILVGGAPLYKADLEEAQDRLGPVITQIYGQGEAPMTITVMPAAESAAFGGVRLGSCGRPFTGVQVRIAGAQDSSEAPPKELGEVCVRGDVVMNGYWNNPEATAAALHEGWLRTGDVGYLDSGGYLHLTDRVKDVIITGGSNVYPREVEEVLLTHPGVSEAAVVGIPDPEWGESVAAFVVTRPGAQEDPAVSAEALVQHVRDHLASFKKPRTITFVPELPKNATGKFLKRQLRDLVVTTGKER